MNPILKKVLFVIGFVLVTLVLPAVLLLMFVDATEGFSFYVITYGVILFAIFGYVIISVRNMEKKIDETMEEIKMQNAAIAYKLSNSSLAAVEEPQSYYTPVVNKEIPVAAEVPVDTSNIPLNPAEPLEMTKVKKVVKVSDDGFDDFK